ncbi:MAG: tyrosine-type recombinase/integrase [Desertifilum sp.]|nr:tyrosine-type recombinase/integrase [Desertifilum sp.]
MYTQTTSGKASKGSCGVESFQGRLRLRLPRSLYGGKQKYLVLGMADTPENRKAAEVKARQIELDILSDNFDSTLAKYKPQTHLTVVEKPKPAVDLLVHQLWKEYLAYKASALKPTSIDFLEKCLGRHLYKCEANPNNALEVRQWLLARTTESMTKRCLTHLCAAYDWAMKHTDEKEWRLLTSNPYKGLANELAHKYEVSSEPNAFLPEEKEKILKAYYTSSLQGQNYRHYAEFVEFLFLTGCRPSEAIGLQWKHIARDCSRITFEGAIVGLRGGSHVRVSKSKTNRVRKFNCGKRLQELLTTMSEKSEHEPESLVFSSPRSKSPINYNNFCKRAWHKVVDPIVNRPTTPYSCRDTFISEQVAKGISSDIVAKWCDNSPEEIRKKYLDNKLLEHLRPLD